MEFMNKLRAEFGQNNTNDCKDQQRGHSDGDSRNKCWGSETSKFEEIFEKWDKETAQEYSDN